MKRFAQASQVIKVEQVITECTRSSLRALAVIIIVVRVFYIFSVVSPPTTKRADFMAIERRH